LILTLPFCAAALLWDRLPDLFPIHWNIRGEIDGYAGKTFGALFLPALNVFLTGLVAVLPRLDPKCRAYDPETQASVGSVFRVFRLMISLFLSAIVLAIYWVAMGAHLDLMRFLAGGLGMMVAVLGNSMGKLRPNYFAGIRTPWTMQSRTVWIKTHRLGARLMVGGGVLILLGSLLVPSSLCLAATLVTLLFCGIVPAVYSYFGYRTEKENATKAP
jgi:uncharacterized membrane protein